MVTPEQAIDAIRGTGGAQPGERALHAKGKLYRGTFTATAEAAQLSRAAHLNGSAVPALIRFSNGAGNPAQRDNAPGIRGMAVKFTLPDGSTTDVSTQTARLFASSTPDGFVALLRAMRPGVAAPLRLAGYVATHPGFIGALPILRAAQRVPASYASRSVLRVARLPMGRRRRQRPIRSLPLGSGRGRGVSAAAGRGGEGRELLDRRTRRAPRSGTGRGSPTRSRSLPTAIRPSIRPNRGTAPRPSPSAPSRSPASTPNASTAATSSCSTPCASPTASSPRMIRCCDFARWLTQRR